jgi:hypothetical protein
MINDLHRKSLLLYMVQMLLNDQLVSTQPMIIRRRMRILLTILLVLSILVIQSCKDNPTKEKQKIPSSPLSLAVSTALGTAPCDITFTGTFNVYTDTTRMRVPDMFLIGCTGMIVVPYALPDTTVTAKRIYSYTQHFPVPGSFSIYMILQTIQERIVSDTLKIIIQ